MNAVAAQPIALIEAGGLRVCFDKASGRVRHSIWTVGDGNADLVLESVEDAEDDDVDGPAAPSVPVLGEVHIQSFDDGRQVALLIGMSGRDHWSMSVAADPSTGQLSFDVACRIHSEATRPGSVYRVVPPATVSGTEPVHVSHPTAGSIQWISDNDNSPAACGRWHSAQSGQLQLSAAAASAPLPRTVRWQFGIRRINR